VARDGVTYDSANYNFSQPDTVLSMGPGNRLDVLVKAPQRTGTYRLQVRPSRPRASLLQTRRGSGTGGGGGGRLRAGGPGQVRALSAAQVDSTLNVTGGLVEVVVVPGVAPDTTMPTSLPPLPPFLANLQPQGNDTAVIVFSDTVPGKKSQSNPAQFFLGNAVTPRMQFSDTVYVPRTSTGTLMPMVLGQTQTWRIENHSPQSINHPFHIHINPFQVLSIQYGPNDPNALLYASLVQAANGGHPIWLDVIPLPVPFTSGGATVPGAVVIRQEYKDFTGDFVMHCHILGHEERGMMALLEISKGALGSAAQPHVVAAAHNH